MKVESGKKVQFMFINFGTIPRTMKEFDDMTKFWLGFQQALNQIGLKCEEVEENFKKENHHSRMKMQSKRLVMMHSKGC